MPQLQRHLEDFRYETKIFKTSSDKEKKSDSPSDGSSEDKTGLRRSKCLRRGSSSKPQTHGKQRRAGQQPQQQPQGRYKKVLSPEDRAWISNMLANLGDVANLDDLEGFPELAGDIDTVD